MARERDWRMIISPDGSVQFAGIDYGPGLTLYPIDGAKDIVAVKQPAHRTWSGRGAQRNVTGRIMLFEIVHDNEDHSLNVRELAEIPLRSHADPADLVVKLLGGR